MRSHFVAFSIQHSHSPRPPCGGLADALQSTVTSCLAIRSHSARKDLHAATLRQRIEPPRGGRRGVSSPATSSFGPTATGISICRSSFPTAPARSAPGCGTPPRRSTSRSTTATTSASRARRSSSRAPCRLIATRHRQGRSGRGRRRRLHARCRPWPSTSSCVRLGEILRGMTDPHLRNLAECFLMDERADGQARHGPGRASRTITPTTAGCWSTSST